MTDAINILGERPWPGTATAGDIRPGVILTTHHLTITEPHSANRTEQWVVVSTVLPESNELYVVTPEQAAEFTYREIVVRLRLHNLGTKMSLYELGIAPSHAGYWDSYTYSVVEGMIPERKGNHQTPFTAIDFPEEINAEGLGYLIADLGIEHDHFGIRTVFEGRSARDGLLILSEKLDKRMITILVLRYNLNGDNPDGASYTQIAKYLSVSTTTVREQQAKAFSKMRGVARTLGN